MRNRLVTPFWRNALHSLPASLRPRYELQFEAAERWELWLDAAVQTSVRAKAALQRMFQHRAPRIKNA